MRLRGFHWFMARISTRILISTVVLLSLVRPGWGQLAPGNFTRINQPGFGDRHNSYPWSMKWFKGKLYVGTNRDFQCVENATAAFYLPWLLPLQAIFPDPQVPCPADPTDLDLRAEVWRYTPEIQTWERVYQSDVMPNPKSPGKFVARDIGYRDMVIFKEQDGTEALYLVGCSAREFTPGLPPPRILRMTVEVDPATGIESEVFEAIPQDPGTVMGDLNAITFRATAVYKNRLYVSASPGLTGDGYVLESSNPRAGNNSFRQVTPNALHVYEMAVFNNFLYLGAGDQTTGYSVWKTSAIGPVPYLGVPVVLGGAGRGLAMTSVVSMFPFNGRLYVGSAGWYSTLLPSSEMIRLNPDDSWELVTGNPRLTTRGMVYPISGLGDGFGNPFNAHIWRMQDHGGILYAGTNDDSWGLRYTPLDPYFRSQYGFDCFASSDGVYWKPVTRNGLGSSYSFGLRSMATTPFGLFVGAVNYVQGAEVWLGKSQSAVSATATMNAKFAADQPRPAVAPPASPERLDVDFQSRSAVLSWNPSPGAAQYRVFRSEYRGTDLGFMLGVGPIQEDADGLSKSRSSRPGMFSLPRQYSPIGVTAQQYFQDRDLVSGRSYAYYVQAEDRWGRPSDPSNIIAVPSFAPPISYEALRDKLGDVFSHRQDSRNSEKRLLDLLSQIRDAAGSKNLVLAQSRLEQLRQELSHVRAGTPDSQAVESLELLISRLARRLSLAKSGVLDPDVMTPAAHAQPDRSSREVLRPRVR